VALLQRTDAHRGRRRNPCRARPTWGVSACSGTRNQLFQFATEKEVLSTGSGPTPGPLLRDFAAGTSAGNLNTDVSIGMWHTTKFIWYIWYVHNIRLKDVECLQARSHVLTTNLKTRLSYGYQGVILVDEVKPYLSWFLAVVRPLLSCVLPISSLREPTGFMIPEWCNEMKCVSIILL
jgi:hypothetical protein